jgi:type I restriction enzyme S subunit
VFRPKKNWHWFLEKFIKSEFSKKRIKQLCSGSVRQSLSFEDLSRIELLIPPIEILEKYNNFYNHIFKKIEINLKKIKLLVEIRDDFISKIYSKKININSTKDFN